MIAKAGFTRLLMHIDRRLDWRLRGAADEEMMGLHNCAFQFIRVSVCYGVAFGL
jgi:hypothetical protein